MKKRAFVFLLAVLLVTDFGGVKKGHEKNGKNDEVVNIFELPSEF